jgi:anti-sigma-K factor RskA
MRTHEQFADDLALYALNELHGADAGEIEAHLETCAACRRELQALRSDLGLLGLSAVGPRPPARSKERLMRAIAAEPRASSAATSAISPGRRAFWLSWIPAALALAAIVFAISLQQSNRSLNDQLAEMRNRYNDQRIQLAHAEENIRLLLAPDAVHVSMTPANTGKHPSATAIVSPSQGRITLMASNLPPVPPGKAYELWVIPPQGAPVNAGVFKPDEHGNAMMLDHPMPAGVQPKTFALTVEDEAGSDKPTSPIVIVGTMGEGQ